MSGMPPSASSRCLMDLQGVDVRFGRVHALSGITLRIAPGERVALVGANGSGKSTLLRVLHGQVPASAGICITALPHQQAMLFQRPHMLRTSAQNNVALGLWLRGSRWGMARKAALAALQRVGLESIAQQNARTLSGGQQQRVALARALAPAPSLLLLDEPFGALDEITRERLNDELLKLFAEKQFAGLFITHSVSEAVYLSTKVVVMSGRPGTIVDTFEVPFDMPRDPEIRFTGEFAGLVGKISHALREGHN